MFEKLTDLALESHELHAEKGEDDGIIVTEREQNGFRVTEALVMPGEGEQKSGKPAGKYITVGIGKVWQKGSAEIGLAAETVAGFIKELLPGGDGSVLVCGLGNEDITPDSIGPLTVKNLIVTRHLKSVAPDFYLNAGFGDLAAVTPGVLGRTGIESADAVAGICSVIKPRCVIVIDSLASRRMARLATTLQIADNGLNPGSGVLNKRAPLSSETLGAPVISLGVPTVVDAATLAYDLLEETVRDGGPEFGQIMQKLLGGSGRNSFVAPKDIDVTVKEIAKLIAGAINLAIHGISPAESAEFI